MKNTEKIKFKIKIDKLKKGDVQLGLFLNKNIFARNMTTNKNVVERYIYICLFKINISIGFMV
ncbi:MAG: hypothetical protein IJ371_06330 [Clostridia bacterium]|nr:hypothetical protein [Clostridia bacterium]